MYLKTRLLNFMSSDDVSDAVLVQKVVECLLVEDTGCVSLGVVGKPIIL